MREGIEIAFEPENKEELPSKIMLSNDKFQLIFNQQKMNLIEIKSPAKLNLHLQVLNRRLDGFHNISSLSLP